MYLETKRTQKILEAALFVEKKFDKKVKTIRQLALLTEIYNCGSKVTKKELSNIASMYGINPKGVGGYFNGQNPLLTKATLTTSYKETEEPRYLTKFGTQKVINAKEFFGSNWLEKINIDEINNPDKNPNDIIEF